MDPDWLTGLFNPHTPAWGMGGSMGAMAPQITPTMLYPFTPVGGNAGAEPSFLTPPQFGNMQGQETNSVGQVLDAQGAPIPSVSGGALPGTEPPSPMGYARSQATGAGAANPNFNPNMFMAGMRGVQAPAPPTPQRISTPNIHAGHAIRPTADQMINMMAALGISPNQLPKIGRI